MQHRVDVVEPRPDYRIWIQFADGLEGTVDLSDLVGKGVFESWRDPQAFARVFVDRESGTVAWPGGIELAPDALYHDVAAVQTP